MLELTNYQIFFMVLHGCLITFAFAFLFKGNGSQKNNKVVSYREFQRKQQRKQRPIQQAQKPPSPIPSANIRDVYEVNEVKDLLLKAASGE